MTRRVLVLVFALLSISAVHAQAPSPEQAPASAAARPFAADASPLTAAEKKDIELLTLKASLASAYRQVADLQASLGACQAQLGPVQFEQNRQALTAEQAALKDAIEKARPGYTWDPQSGAFAKKPDPPVVKK